jgi:WD40 repeat protein
VPNCALRLTLRGHSCSVGAVVFHPSAVREEESAVCALASCAADGSVKLWTMKRYADYLNGCSITSIVVVVTCTAVVTSTVVVVTCTVVVLTCVVMCGCVYVWFFVMCGCVYMCGFL